MNEDILLTGNKKVAHNPTSNFKKTRKAWGR
jgi:hypothetical protein